LPEPEPLREEEQPAEAPPEPRGEPEPRAVETAPVNTEAKAEPKVRENAPVGGVTAEAGSETQEEAKSSWRRWGQRVVNLFRSLFGKSAASRGVPRKSETSSSAGKEKAAPECKSEAKDEKKAEAEAAELRGEDSPTQPIPEGDSEEASPAEEPDS
jgi:hypothetical protein